MKRRKDWRLTKVNHTNTDLIATGSYIWLNFSGIEENIELCENMPNIELKDNDDEQ